MAEPKSFVENVNTIANATTLATGDIIEDTQLARDAAEASAIAAALSEDAASASELTAEDWSNKGFNNEVITGEFSSYHWSVIAAQNAGDYLIDDNITSTNFTWSSSKIIGDISTKAHIDHGHSGIYEPVITKNTAFNQNFGGTGVATDVSRMDHNHTTTYEPLIGAKGTAFNKDFGTNSGEIAEGDHMHDLAYMSKVTVNTAYNKNFGTASGDVSEGNHIHNSVNVVYDPTGDKVVTSTTVDGALSQLDAEISILAIGERCTISAGMTNQSAIVTITTQDTPTQVITAMTISGNSDQMLYSGGDTVIDYDVTPEKLIEGWFTTTLTVEGEVNTKYSIALGINGTVIDTDYRGIVGSSTAQSVGTYQLNLSGYV